VICRWRDIGACEARLEQPIKDPDYEERMMDASELALEFRLPRIDA
jgi:hypothetical protein